MNRRAAGRPIRVRTRIALLVAALLPMLGAAAPAPVVREPWSVRRELNRAEAILRQQDARLHVDEGVQVLRESERVVLRVPARLLFLPDSESLRPSLTAAQMLSVPTLLLRRRHHLMTRIEVYTDNIGGVQLNQQLSARRAAVLAQALLRAGISLHRIQATGRGAAQALAGNDSAEGRSLNRRVEFVFARLGSQAALPPPTDAGATLGAGDAGLRPERATATAGG